MREGSRWAAARCRPQAQHASTCDAQQGRRNLSLTTQHNASPKTQHAAQLRQAAYLHQHHLHFQLAQISGLQHLQPAGRQAVMKEGIEEARRC